MIKKVKKFIALALVSTMLTGGALSSAVNAADYTTFGPYYLRLSNNKQLYKYTTAISVGKSISVTLDGNNSIKRQVISSPKGMQIKEVSTYACIYKGVKEESRFNNGNLFNYPASSSSINKGLIVVSAAASYYVGGTAIESKAEKEASTNSVSVNPNSITTSEALTGHGTIEYRNNDDTLYAFLTTVNY